eukprot:5353508-Pleurochrysis_carterae.AAC.1
MFDHSPPSTADVTTNLGESSKARARRLPVMHTCAISKAATERIFDDWNKSFSTSVTNDGAVIYDRKAFSGLHVLAQENGGKICNFVAEAELAETEKDEKLHSETNQGRARTRQRHGSARPTRETTTSSLLLQGSEVGAMQKLSLIHISEPTRRTPI